MRYFLQILNFQKSGKSNRHKMTFYLLRFVFALALAVSISSNPVSVKAQDYNCEKADELPQQGMNFCAFLDFESADAELNLVWKNVFPEIKKRDAELPENLRGWGNALLEAQRAWIKYRDAHCTSEGFQVRGGSLEPLFYHTCRSAITRSRIKELKSLLQEG